MYIAIIGDIVGSKELKDRNKVQKRLNYILQDINTMYREDIKASFLITLGDEFQGLLSNPHNVMKIVEYIQVNLYPVKIRFGIGVGNIDTDFTRDIALGADGPAYHRARKMVDELKNIEKSKKNQSVSVRFMGLDKNIDMLINSSLNGISLIYQNWTQKQRDVIIESLKDKSIKYVSEKIGITQSSVYKRLSSSGYYDYTNMRDTVTNVLDNIWGDMMDE